MIQATERAAVFVRAIEEHTLQAQYIVADRTGNFFFTDIWPDNISSDCRSLMFYWSFFVTCTVSVLV